MKNSITLTNNKWFFTLSNVDIEISKILSSMASTLQIESREGVMYCYIAFSKAEWERQAEKACVCLGIKTIPELQSFLNSSLIDSDICVCVGGSSLGMRGYECKLMKPRLACSLAVHQNNHHIVSFKCKLDDALVDMSELAKFF